MHGFIQVELLDERELATYTVRKLLIRHTRVSTQSVARRAPAPGYCEGQSVARRAPAPG